MSTHTTITGPPVSPATTPPAAARRPGTTGYWLGALVAILATVGALAWGTLTFLDWRSDLRELSRLTSPGTASVSVVDPARIFVYVEHVRTTAAATPTVSVTGPSGDEVVLRPYGAQLRYDVPGEPGRVGDAVLSFAADRPGDYQVTVTDLQPDTAVAVGDHLARGFIPEVVGSIGLLLGGLLAGLVLVIVTAARRAGSTT